MAVFALYLPVNIHGGICSVFTCEYMTEPASPSNPTARPTTVVFPISIPVSKPLPAIDAMSLSSIEYSMVDSGWGPPVAITWYKTGKMSKIIVGHWSWERGTSSHSHCGSMLPVACGSNTGNVGFLLSVAEKEYVVQLPLPRYYSQSYYYSQCY